MMIIAEHPPKGTRVRIIIHPLSAPDREVDVTASLIRAIANDLGVTTGGNEVLNELEAECHLRCLLCSSGAAPEESAGAA